MVEAKVLLALLARHYNVQLADGDGADRDASRQQPQQPQQHSGGPVELAVGVGKVVLQRARVRFSRREGVAAHACAPQE